MLLNFTQCELGPKSNYRVNKLLLNGKEKRLSSFTPLLTVNMFGVIGQVFINREVIKRKVMHFSSVGQTTHGAMITLSDFRLNLW